MAARITAQDFDELVLKADVPVLVDFYSDTCVPCKMMSGVVGDIEDETEETAKIYKVNVNYEESLAETYSVLSVPTFLVFQGGAETARLTGVVAKDVLMKALTNN